LIDFGILAAFALAFALLGLGATRKPERILMGT